MKIAAVGDNCMDVYESLGKAFPGGNPVNVAVYCKRLGHDASYIGAVGTDKYGKIMMDALNAKGVDTSRVQVLEGDTAITEVELKNGDRVFGDYREGVLAQFKLSSEDIDFLCGHDLVVSGIWGNVEMDMQKIRDRGVTVAFDFSDQLEHEVVERGIDKVDYAFFACDTDDEAFVREYLKKRHAQGPKLVIMTMGDKGSLVYDGETFTQYGIVPCEVVDTMGAGDSFIAGFLCSIMQGKEIAQCMHDGAANSSVTIAYQGAW